ncbi:MAG: recombinase family protein [Oscillospiraceae bacterium]
METDLWVREEFRRKEQNEARGSSQHCGKCGCPSENVYLDKQSGADFERVQYRRMLRRLGPGDTLIVKSIDRLGRNYTEILEQWRIITKSKRAAIVILDMPLLDTRQNRDLTGQLIADIVLQLLSYVAQTEREFIRQRQAEGIVAAKERGVHFGREAAPVSEDFPEILANGAQKSSARGRRPSGWGCPRRRF